MPNERKFVFATNGRTPAWLRVWLTIAAIAAGAVFVWVGLVLLLVVLLVAALALLPVWAWRFLTANRRPAGPATIEGEYTISTPSAIESKDGAPRGSRTGDAERPDDRS